MAYFLIFLISKTADEINTVIILIRFRFTGGIDIFKIMQRK